MDATNLLEGLLASMTLENEFWGYLFSRIKKIPTEEIEFPMGVRFDDDRYEMQLFYKPSIIEKTKEKVLMKILEHEGIHLLNKHPSRTQKFWGIEKIKKELTINQFAKISNIAADLAVNSQMGMPEKLIIDDKEFKPWLPEAIPLLPKMSYEYYYIELRKIVDENKNGGGDGDCEHCWFDPDAPDSDAVAHRMDMATFKLVKDAVKSYNKRSRGNLPGYLQELIDGILIPPALPYYQMIAKLVKGTRLAKYKRSPVKLNRKRLFAFMDDMPTLIPFPGKKRDKTFHLGLLIDTSGSRGKEDIMEDLSAIRDIIENDPFCRVTVIQVDTQVQEERDIRKLSDIREFKIRGRGGTTLGPGLERFKAIAVDIVLAFSDGYCENINGYRRNTLPRKLVWCIPERNGTEDYIKGSGIVVRIPDIRKRND
jgi:predicted metal-dependent peptidase